MGKFGELLENRRNQKKISLKKASKDLKIKIHYLKALEDEEWPKLPQPPFTKGFITSYANYLGLDPLKILALYRREYDETKYPKEQLKEDEKRRFYLTPTRIINFAAIFAIFAFITYLAVGYSSVFSAPKLEISSPQEDIKVSIPAIIIQGTTEVGATVSIGGEFIPVNENGDFSYQYNLDEGKNTIEIIASRRLSPKSRATRTVRLLR